MPVQRRKLQTPELLLLLSVVFLLIGCSDDDIVNPKIPGPPPEIPLPELSAAELRAAPDTLIYHGAKLEFALAYVDHDTYYDVGLLAYAEIDAQESQNIPLRLDFIWVVHELGVFGAQNIWKSSMWNRSHFVAGAFDDDNSWPTHTPVDLVVGFATPDGDVLLVRTSTVIKRNGSSANNRIQLTSASVTRAAGHPARRTAEYGGRGRS